MAEAFVGLGSNLAQPARQVSSALARLAAWPGVTAFRASRLYRTPPWGETAQPDFINAVAAFEYAGSARSLLTSLLAIEREAGRVRDDRRRWGPRVLDMDLLLFGDASLRLPHLSVPHPRLHERAFVLWPLAELAPARRLPGGATVAELAAVVESGGIVAL